jgi:hypothetical protein
MNGKADQQLQELKTVVDNAQAHLQQSKLTKDTAAVPRVEQAIPRVEKTVPRVEETPIYTRQTRAATKTRTRSKRKPSTTHLTATIHLPNAPPAQSTQSKVKAATVRSTAKDKPTATKPTSDRRSNRLHQHTASSRRKSHTANAVFESAQFNNQFVLIYHRHEQAFAAGVMDKDTGKILQYRQLLRHPQLKQAWTKSSANEFGRLAKGVGGRIKNPTETIRFIKYEDIPKNRRKDVTYGSFVCSVRPEKIDEPNRTRFTAGGDKINYPGEVATPTAEMLVAKILFNSVISTRGAKFMTIDISNFYLNTTQTTDIPDEIIHEYRLKKKVDHKGFVNLEVTKGMYGLPQAGLLANELLEQ